MTILPVPTLTTAEIGTISAIGSAVVPPIVSFLKAEKWSAQVKQLLALVISIGVAALGDYASGVPFSTTPFVQLVSLIAVGSQFVYGAYFRHSNAELYLRALGTRRKKRVRRCPSAPVATTAEEIVV